MKLKEQKLTNIYSGRKLSLIIKKLENNNITLINLNYPLSNTTSIEVRKLRNNFEVKENWVTLLELVLTTVIASYFGGRSYEKVKIFSQPPPPNRRKLFRKRHKKNRT